MWSQRLHGPRLGPIPLAFVGGLTRRAGPFGERAYRVIASLIGQAASGILSGVRRSLRLTSDLRLRIINRPSLTGVEEIPAQLLEDWCG